MPRLGTLKLQRCRATSTRARVCKPAARAPRRLPRHPPTLTPVHPLLPRRRAEGNSNDGKVCRLCRGGTPGEGPAEGASGPAQEDRGRRRGKERDEDKT